MKQPQTKLKTDHGIVTFTWINDPNLEKYRPYYQVYGVCFNPKGEILIIKEKKDWKIPGGTPQNNETPEQTLIREIKEEASVVIKNPLPLGAQKVEYPNNPNKEQGPLFYQYRYICQVEKILPPAPDPATGKINKRKFVIPKIVTNYIQWGPTGDALFKDAVEKIKKC